MADSALRILQPCLEGKKALKSLSAETCGRIFRLAALSSIMTGNPTNAEKYARQMLQYLPDYNKASSEGDLMEFRLMLEKITAIPSLRITVDGGVNIPLPSLTKHYSNYSSVSGSESLTSSPGYTLGISVEKMFSRKFSVEGGIETGRYNFKYSVKETAGGTSDYEQNIYSLEVPVVARYYLTTGRFKPYVNGGIAGRFLLGAYDKSDTYGKYWLTNAVNSDMILTTFFSDIEYVKLVLGAGASYDIKKFRIKLDIRYDQSFGNSSVITAFDNIGGYTDFLPTDNFYYTDDINLVSFNNLRISFGLTYNLRYRVF